MHGQQNIKGKVQKYKKYKEVLFLTVQVAAIQTHVNVIASLVSQ